MCAACLPEALTLSTSLHRAASSSHPSLNPSPPGPPTLLWGVGSQSKPVSFSPSAAPAAGLPESSPHPRTPSPHLCTSPFPAALGGLCFWGLPAAGPPAGQLCPDRPCFWGQVCPSPSCPSAAGRTGRTPRPAQDSGRPFGGPQCGSLPVKPLKDRPHPVSPLPRVPRGSPTCRGGPECPTWGRRGHLCGQLTGQAVAGWPAPQV